MLLIVCVVAFELATHAVGRGLVPALLYLPLPLILWAAVRFGAKGASAAVMIVTVVLIWRALNGPSLFGGDDPETKVFGIQAFLLGLAIPILLLGAAIEETRKAERAIRESEDRMAFAAASANVCLWHFDRKNDEVWMTEHGRRIFGFGLAETITRSAIINAIHPDDRDAVLGSMRSAAAGKLVDNEFRIVRRDGSIHWILARARTHSDEQGHQTLVSGTFADVTDRRMIEQEAASQRRELAHLTRVSMLGELSAGIAHELTQPLTAILSNAQAARHLLTNHKPDLIELSEALDDIISEDNRAGEVIHRLRGLMKKGESKRESVDLNDVVHSTLRLLHTEMINRRTKVRTDLDGGLPMVTGDAVQLQQVLLNLMMNAMDAMNHMDPSGRTIMVATRTTRDGLIELTVVDRGKGIDSVKRPHLFQPFFTTKQTGLGLGLSICSSIIKSHGGTLDLTNNANGGATARFRLPERQLVTGETS
jgi:PAS domain S-box-containing protein